MLNNFFKFFTVVFLLAMFQQNSFAQDSKQGQNDPVKIVLPSGDELFQINGKYDPITNLRTDVPYLDKGYVNTEAARDIYFVSGFEESWTFGAPTGWTFLPVANANNSWHRNDYTTGWSSVSGSYNPVSYMGGFSARFHSYDVSAGTFGSMTTPNIDLSTASDSVFLSFWWTNALGTDSLYIDYSIDGGTSFTTLGFVLTTGGPWFQAIAPIPSTSATTQIRFRARGDFGTSDIGLDEVVLYQKGPAYSGVLSLPGTFTSFTDAARKLSLFGVSGSTTINVAAGTYQDSVTFSPIPGASAINTISFIASGTVTVQRAGVLTAGATVGSTLARTDDATISLWGADYMTFDGIGISDIPGLTTNEWGYLVRAFTPTDGSNYNTIKNCLIVMNKTNINTRGIRHFPFWVLSAQSGASSYNHYYANDIRSCGFQGILLQGGAPYIDVNNEVASVGGTARFFDIGGGSGSANALAISGQNGVKVYGCDIDSIWVTSGAVNSILLGTGTTGGDSVVNFEIYNNQIRRLVQTAGSSSTILTAIRIPGHSNGLRGKIYNNFISNLRSNGSSTTSAIAALYHQGGTNTNVEWYYNTVLLDNPVIGTNGNNVVVRLASGSGIATMRNNIFVNKSSQAGTGKNYIYYRDGGTQIFSNNGLYVDTTLTNRFVGIYGSIDRKTLGAWQSASGTDVNTVYENPNFVNSTTLPFDLHINPSFASQFESGGTSVAGITTDFDGDARNVTLPDIGADEFIGTPLDLVPPSITYIPLINTGSISARTLTATITDATGVPTIGAGLPVLYWKINFSGSWTGATATYLSGNNYQFTYGSGVVPNDSVYYYIVAQDNVSPTPNIGAFPSGGAGGFTTNPPAAATPPTTPSAYRVVPAFSGTYTVGTAGNYATLTGAAGLFASINNGVLTGNVTAQIISDLTEDGANALNQWLEEGAGNYTLSISPNSATERLISGAVANGLIRFNGSDRVTVDGRFGGSGKYLRFRNTNTSNSVFTFINSAIDNNISYCYIEGASTSATTNGVVFFSTGNNKNNVISYCDIRDLSNATGLPANGVYFAATSDSNNTIANCNIFNFSQYAVNISAASGTTVESCEIYSAVSTSTTLYGIIIGNTNANLLTKISKNKIYNITGGSTAAVKGIYYSGSSSVTQNVSIENNMISLSPTTTANVDGIDYFGYSANSVNIYHNSVYLGGTLASGTNASYGIRKRDAATNFNMKNNAVFNARSNSGGTASHYGVYFNNIAGTLAINYNDYYVNGTGSVLGFWNAANTNTLADWQIASTQDANSISIDPKYTSTNDLHLNTSFNNLDGKGTYLASVPTDIDGDTRNATTPDIGADEYIYIVPTVIDPTAFAALTVSGSQIDLTWTKNVDNHNVMIATNSVNTFGVPVNNTAYNVSDPIAGGGTVIYTGPASGFNHTGLNVNTQYFYKAWSYNPTNIYSPGVTANATTVVVNPTAVTAVPFSTSQIDLGWTKNSNNDNVMVVTNTVNTFGVPVNGTAYIVSDPVVGGGTVVYNGSAAAFNHTLLNAGTTYYYKVFSAEIATNYYSSGAAANATTLADPISVFPYTQNFEESFPPIGWLNYGAKLWTQSLTDGRSATKGARVSYLPAGTANLEMIPVILPATPNYRIKFWWKDDDIASRPSGQDSEIDGTEIVAHDTTYFEVSTNGGTSWTVLSFLAATSAQSAYVESVNDLTPFSGQTVTLRWRDVSDGTSSAYGTGLDDITIEQIPSVLDPTAVTATAVSTTQIALAFTPNLAGNNVVIVWNNTGTFTVPSGTPPAVGQPFAGGTLLSNGIVSPVNHSGLTASTTYYYKAFSNSGLDYSSGIAASATTFCDPVGLPFAESFDATLFPPTCWTSINAGTGEDWYRSTSSPYAGAGNMRYQYSVTSAANAWMITPGMTLTGGTKYLVSFYQKTGGFPEKLKITVGTVPSVAGQTTTIWNNAGGTDLTNTVYILRTAEYTPTSTGSYYFGFNCYSDADQFYLSVDEILVDEAPTTDIGIVSLTEAAGTLLKESIVPTGLSREITNSEAAEDVKKLNNLLLSIIPQESGSYTEAGPVNFKVAVKNFGGDTQNTYQVGWNIDGNVQTAVNNTQPLAGGATDTLTLTWAIPVAGLHTVRGWTILAGDINTANDSSSVFGFYVAPENSVYLERFNGTVPPAGWDTLNVDGGGITPSWFAGNPTVFPSLEGTGYAGSNYNGGNGLYIDQWLISPNTGGVTEAITDSLVFWMRSPTPGTFYYPDSVQILVSTTGKNTGDFTSLLQYIQVPTNWTRFAYPLPNAANRYVAFRYLHYNGGAVGDNSNYVGLDLVEIQRHTTGPATFPLTVNLNAGWNMVSTPGSHPVNQDVLTWWSGKDPAAGVFRFSGGYLPVTTTTPGEGYWMKNLSANVYNTGDEWPVGGIQIVPNVPIAGATGWNLIGGFELSVLTANITTTPGGLQSGQVFGYSGGYTPATNLVPGYGYWIKLTGAGSINIPTSLAKGVAKTTEVNTSDWGKIIITDALGKSYTLYTVKGEVNLNDYELPPAPPTGMFDVRFGSGRYAEELSAVNQSIELNSLEYPVKVRVENADIRLQDGTGNGLNERLKSGEEVTISNSAINKLMVSGDVIPATYSLDQNYPNPFNPSTKIEFSIPEDVNNVTLTIFNTLGQRVAELVNSKLEAGKYSYVWNAGDVATGLYIYELRTDKFVSVKKMMLLK